MNQPLQLPLMNLSVGFAVGNLDAYIHRVNKIPLLTAEEEKTFAEQVRADDNITAARQLVLAHLRYVVRVARGYAGYGLPLSDLIQEGNLGLMKAVKRFNPDMGVRLVSFAVHWIKAEIHEFVLRNWRIVKVATTKAQRKLFFNLRSMKKRLGWLSREEVRAVAEDLGVTQKVVLEMEKRLNINTMDISYDGTDNDEEGSFKAPAHYLPMPDSDPALLFEQQESSGKERKQLMKAFKQIDERSRDILQHRWLSEKKSTLHELADKYSVSAERVRQLEKNAMKKLRSLMESC